MVEGFKTNFIVDIFFIPRFISSCSC